MPLVNFFCEDIAFNLPKPRKTIAWIKQVVSDEGFKLKSIAFVFCSDPYLHQINLQYLKHNTYTDIITFDNSEGDGEIEGDIFISVERVKENSQNLKSSFQEEVHRVMIHGVLHLVGYKDKTKNEKLEMRTKEDLCLSLPSVPRETF
jgi:probable rRNA maturation factor